MADGTLSGGTVSLPVKPATAGFGRLLEAGVVAESGGLGGLGMRMGGLILGGIAALGIGRKIGEFIGTGIREFTDAEDATAQLNAGLISTGNVANLNVKSMTDLAASIQAYSGQTDDSIMKTEQVLQTFTNIRNLGPDKIFDQATIAAADMAAKLGGDASSSAIQLGKALNDPIKGVAALTRVGVSFTDAQKEQITALQDSGDMLGAQKIILAELSKEFGGAAEAAGQTFGGTLERLKRTGEDLAQSVLGTVLPAVQPLVDKLVTGSQMLQQSPGFQKILDGLTTFATTQGDKIGGIFDKILAVFSTDSKNPLGELVATFAKSNPLLTVLLTTVNALQPVLPVLYQALAEIAPALIPVLPVLAQLVVQLLPVFADLLIQILPVIPSLTTMLITLMPAITGIADALGAMVSLQAGADTFFISLISNLASGKTGVSDFVDLLLKMPDSLQGVIFGATNFIAGVVNFSIDALNGIMAIIPGFANMISDALGLGIHVSAFKIPHVGSLSLTVETGPKGQGSGQNVAKRAALGGTFEPQPGGHLVNLAEAGRAETVVDTETLRAAVAANRGGNTFNIYETSSPHATAMQVARINNKLAAA